MNARFTSPLLLFVFAMLFSTNTNAQLANGATAPDWTFTDINGTSHNLYTYLDQGMNVVLDMSATWCPPCWNYHNTHILEDFYQAKGPNGTGEVMVFHVEADPSTNQQCIYGQAGCNGTSLGDWTDGVTYPILNLNSTDASWMNNNYNINFFPTLYNICPDRRVWEVGQPQQAGWENWITSCSLEASGMVTSNEDCFGQNTGAISTTSMGGLGTPNFQWSNGSSAPNLSGVGAGTYSCTVSEAQGYFVEIGPFVVTGPPAPLAINVTNNTTVTCAGSPTGSISTSASGGTAGYQYQWSNGSTQPNISGLLGGNYSLVVTDANGCVETQIFTINEPDPLTLIGTPVSATCGQNNGIIVLTAGGGTSGYMYDIGTGPSTNNQFFNLPPGPYTATVTDANGCTETTTVPLSFIPSPVSAAGPDKNLSCTTPQVTLEGNASSTGNNITYTWTTNTGNIVSGGTTPTPIVDATGLYTLHVTDSSTGCIATDEVIVLGNTTLPTAVVASSNELNCAVTNITLDASGSSIGSAFSYEWTTTNGNIVSGANSLTPTVDASGIYVLTVSNSTNQCSAAASVEIISNTAIPTATATVSGSIDCNNAIVTIDGSASSSNGNTAFEWLDNNNISIGNQSIISAAAAGVYTLVVTDTDNNCTSSTQVSVTENIQVPAAVASASNDLDCNNAIATLDAMGSATGTNISYEWIDANGISIGTGFSIPVSAAGQYMLVVTDIANGCNAQSAVIVNQNINTPTSSIATPGNINCNNNTVTLDGTASTTGNNISYEWQDENGSIISTSNNVTVSNSGTYTLTVMETQSGCTASSSIIVTNNNTPPIANIANNGTLTCSVNTFTLDGTNSSAGNNITYEWLDANGNSMGTNNTLDVSSSGTYELIVTNNDNGCSASSTATVTQSATLPIADAGVGNTITCNNAFTTLDGSNSSTGANITYQWLDVTGVTVGTDITAQVSDPGLYYLVVFDTDNGCQSQSSVAVGIDISLPNVNITSSGVLSCDVTNVTLEGSSAAGANISFTWLNANGTILGNNTSIDVNSPGEYELIISNNDNGCTNSSTINVVEDAVSPFADAGNNGQLDCNNTTVILDGGNSSTGTNFTYEWMDANGNIISTDLTVAVSSSAIYNLIVTNTDNGCTATSSTEVLVNISTPVANAGMGSQLDCASTSVILDGSGSSTGNNFTYTWTDPNGNIISNDVIAQATTEGIFTLTVTDANNGCTEIDQVTVTASNDFPTAAVAASNNIDCANSTVLLTGMGSSSGTTYNYEWLNSAGVSLGTDLTVEVNAAGTYTLVVTNTNNGCSASNEIAVLENIDTPIAVANAISALSCNNSSTTIDGMGSATGSQYTYEWTNANGTTISTDLSTTVSTPGVYTLTITNTTTGCLNTASTEVISSATPPTADAGTGGALNCTVTSLILDGTNSSVGGNIFYEWSTNNGSITSGSSTLNPTINAPGVYQLTVTNNENGCTAESTVTVEQIPSMNISLANQTDASCFGSSDGSASIDVSGGAGDYTYNWSNGNTTATINDVPAGEYIVMVTDADNCTDTYQVTINEPTELAGSITFFDISCNGANDGQATATVMGANTPTYLWSNGMTTNAVTGLSIGTYTVTMSDDSNCPIEQVVTIAEPTAIVGTLLETVNTDCANASNGSATVEGQGGVGTLTYLWSIGINTPTASNLSAGTYTVSITDENFCTNTIEVTIEAEDTEMPIAAAQNITLPLNQNGIASLDVSMVDNGSSDNCGITNMVLDINQFDCDNLGENTVNLSVVDGAGNSNTTTAIITIVDDLAPTIETCPENLTSNSCNGVSYALPTAIDNCDTSTPMLVSGLASGEIFPEGITEVVYMFSDASGNEVMCSFTVTVENNLNLLVDNITPTTDGQANGAVDISITGGTMPYNYFWTSNGVEVSNSEDLTDVPSGEYELLVTDNSGCIIASEIITIDNMVANENVLLDKFIQIHPNPTSGMIFVHVNLPQNSNVQLEVFDITGRSLMAVPAQNISQQLVELNLSQFTSGVYILKVKVDDELLAKRLILQK